MSILGKWIRIPIVGVQARNRKETYTQYKRIQVRNFCGSESEELENIRVTIIFIEFLEMFSLAVSTVYILADVSL